MSKLRVALVYYSTYGTNYEMARVAEEALKEAGAEVRLRRVRETAPEEVVEAQEAWREQLESMADVPEASPDDMEWADAYFFSTPTRYGGAASQMRAFIDSLGPLWQEGKLADKAVTAMTSAQNSEGGQETTLITLYITFMHWGSIIVPPGYTDEAVFKSGGNPYGSSVKAGGEGLTESDRDAVRHQAERLVRIARKLKS
jgi:NAD(P)H dehydrogenase (quinone)